MKESQVLFRAGEQGISCGVARLRIEAYTHLRPSCACHILDKMEAAGARALDVRGNSGTMLRDVTKDEVLAWDVEYNMSKETAWQAWQERQSQ